MEDENTIANQTSLNVSEFPLLAYRQAVAQSKHRFNVEENYGLGRVVWAHQLSTRWE